MRGALVVLLALATAGPALADDCDALAADVVRQEGATYLRRSSIKVFLQHPYVPSLAVDCIPSPGISFATNSPFPAASVFDHAARIGALVTGAPVGALREGLIDCHKAALRAKDETADHERRGIRFECQAFTRNGGGTFFDLGKVVKPR